MHHIGKARKAATYIQYLLISLLILVPVVWLVVSSFKPSSAVVSYPPVFKFTPIMDNYVKLFKNLPYMLYTLNSILIAGGSTILGLLLAVPAAFAVSWYKKSWPTSVALLARMAPGGLYLLPWYIIFSRLGINGTYLALILTHTVITMPLSLLIMTSFFDELPRELMECGMVDGYSLGGVIIKIAVPLSAPGMVVSTVLTFILSWNYFLFALVLSKIRTTPLTVAAFKFVGEGVTDWGMLMAAATVLAIPPLVITFFAQKWLVQGLTYGAVKG
jgi:multiple sugar transport system permease protein